MPSREARLRVGNSVLYKEEVEERVQWAEAVLETFGGPGGAGRYTTPEDAKAARVLYMRAYGTIWRKGRPAPQESETHKLHKKERRRRPPDIKQFFLTMLQAPEAICAYCEVRLKPWQREADHYIPLGRGGAHAASNLVVCCHSCNASKGIKTPEEFEEWKMANRKGPVE